ncbi:hypothetical protein PU560_10050, partial [Georgenia sp. 10Sc9-8]|nr:hypothetical protein [Georgenia halotolerans]
PGTVRQHYEQEVEASYRRYSRGELDLRALHLELAQTMREFTGHRLGTDVRSWTRADAAGHGATQRVGELLARWEEPAFAARSDAEAAASVHAAREVIRSW